MNVRGRLLATCLVAVVTLTAAGRLHAAETFGDITVEPEPLDAVMAEHGYIEHRLRLTNLAPQRNHLVTLVYPHRSYGSGHYIRELRRTVVVAPGARLVVALPQPAMRAEGDSLLAVTIDGRYVGEVTMPNPGSFYAPHSYGAENAPRVLLSRGLNQPAVEWRVQELLAPTQALGRASSSSSREEKAVVLLRPETDAPGWSDSWLAYSRFDGVVVTAADFGAMPAAVRQALWR